MTNDKQLTTVQTCHGTSVQQTTTKNQQPNLVNLYLFVNDAHNLRRNWRRNLLFQSLPTVV